MNPITEYGLIGEKLPHSYSVEIHNALADYDYRLCELSRDKLVPFLTEKAFRGINVTIPYKKEVMPHLSYIDEKARAIGAVNTIIHRDGKLLGYNTDYYGLLSLFYRASIEISGKKALVLGTGGTSRTAQAVLHDAGAKSVVCVSRKGGNGTVTYEEAARMTDTELIVNTTPVGMFPEVDGCPIDLSLFPQLCGVVDAIYHPLRTNLVLNARKRGIPAIGGLYMLVAQAQTASCLFLGKEPEPNPEQTEAVYRRIQKQKENIVLIGMPSCGKSTVGQCLAQQLGRSFMDADTVFTHRYGVTPGDCIRKEGEAAFREKEHTVVEECALADGAVIATGGGAVLRQDNIRALTRNGRLYFLDRSLEKLLTGGNRPLSSSCEALKNLYDTRYPLYEACCQKKIPGDGTPEETAERVLADFESYKEEC